MGGSRPFFIARAFRRFLQKHMLLDYGFLDEFLITEIQDEKCRRTCHTRVDSVTLERSRRRHILSSVTHPKRLFIHKLELIHLLNCFVTLRRLRIFKLIASGAKLPRKLLEDDSQDGLRLTRCDVV